MPYTIVRFDASMLSLLPKLQKPFEIIGRLVPVYNGQEVLMEYIRTQEIEELKNNDNFTVTEYFSPFLRGGGGSVTYNRSFPFG